MEGCTSHTQVQQLVLSRYFVGVWLNILIVLSVGSLSVWVYQALVEPTGVTSETETFVLTLSTRLPQMGQYFIEFIIIKILVCAYVRYYY